MDSLGFTLHPLPGAARAWQGITDGRGLVEACRRVKEAGGRLVALWASDDSAGRGCLTLRVALALRQGLAVVAVELPPDRPEFPDLSGFFHTANRMQRAAADLVGVSPARPADRRPWLRHGAWAPGQHPLRGDFDPSARGEPRPDNYPFVPVEGDGVHEIPVGPVHAGTIEPGHFRFSIVGERVLKLEERLGYKHKGIERLARGMGVADGARLAGRVSGDSTVAYAWAYAMAVEGAAGHTPPERALWLRALLLERERVANHLGDLGYLGNDAGLAFGLAQFSCLKEEWLRTQGRLFGHRYLMDRVLPGGVAVDLDADAAHTLVDECARVEEQLLRLRRIYDEHPGLQDRLVGAGTVGPELAARIGLTGMAGRASGLAWDLRVQYPCAPYEKLDVRMATQQSGDVAARVAVRFDEALESLRLIRRIAEKLPAGPVASDLPPLRAGATGLGWIEGWRGEVLVALETGPGGTLARLHPHDPSWHNWPALEHAIMENIVPDFPLINKSFNLSYSGHDL